MITSTQNNQVKYWAKLKQRKYREKNNEFLIEGFHLVEEAYNSGWEIEVLIYKQSVQSLLPNWSAEVYSIAVDDKVFQSISQTVQPQGLAAIVKMKEWNKISDDYTVLVDSIQDPGNLGTIIRTADAAGFTKVVLGNGTVDMYNDKVIRASQGSIFHIPVVSKDLREEITILQSKNILVLASALEHAISYESVQVTGKSALIVGNEGSGIKKELLEVADKIVKIPIYGKAESLNVSVAAGILMYYMRK